VPTWLRKVTPAVVGLVTLLTGRGLRKLFRLRSTAMPRYKAISSKKVAERAYPWRVDIEVPGTGLGSRLNEMHEWCRDRSCRWEQHSRTQWRPGDIPLGFARFYFMADTDAAAFLRRWGGTLSRR
jgi:hypothetical protein